MLHPLDVDDGTMKQSLTGTFQWMLSWICDVPLYSQRLVVVELVSQSDDDSVVEVVFRRALIYQHVYGAVSSVVPRPRDWTGRDSRPVLRASDATKNVGSDLLDHSGIKRAAERKSQIVDHGQYC